MLPHIKAYLEALSSVHYVKLEPLLLQIKIRCIMGELQNLEVQLHQRELRCQGNLAQRLLQLMLTRHCPAWQLPSLNNRHLLSQLLLGDSRLCRVLQLLQTAQLHLA